MYVADADVCLQASLGKYKEALEDGEKVGCSLTLTSLELPSG